MKRKKMFLRVYIELTNIYTLGILRIFSTNVIKKRGGGGDDVILLFSGRKKESVNIYIERKSEQSSGIRIPPHLKQIYLSC